MRHRVLKLCALALVAVLGAGCSSTSFNSDFDPTVAFSGYQTWQWIEIVDPSIQLDRGMDQLVERRIKNAVQNELEAKGYNRDISGTPDFVVNFLLSTQDKVDVRSYYTGWGYSPYGGMQAHARQWTEGTLIIDVIDMQKGEVAWRGWAQGALASNPTAEQITRAVNEVTAEILKRFPPDSE